ncbi:MAG: hypothetical protein Tsb0020_38300 [Haliangiales bacterium]
MSASRPPRAADIAVIGVSATLPGAASLDELHDLLASGRDAVGPLPRLRRKYSRVARGDYQVAGYLERVDEFDPEFFQISPREAERMDPQQRILLERCCAAIENAGYRLGDFRGSRTGVYVGATASSYIENPIDPSTVLGNLAAPLAGRVSYVLDLRGPSLVLDTACSSSLVAIHQACGALQLGECDYAIAAGIVIFTDFYQKAKGRGVLGVVAPDGRSKSFDAAADGTGLGEGVGVVLLKPLARALAERDLIHAVIRGTSINQDGGRSNGLTAPSPSAQADVISQAWERAAVDPATIGFFEAHGTGTKLGDPIEIDGMNRAFARYTEARGFCPVSAIKSNIGHLGSAAGVASFLKVVLALQRRQLYPSLHFETPNPLIAFDDGAVYVNRELRPWPEAAHPRRASVSSYGVSGTNAHAILEEAPAPAPDPAPAERDEQLVTLSARTAEALGRYAARMSDALVNTEASLADIAFVLNAGRDDHGHRWAGVATTVDQLRGQMDELRVAAPGERADAEPASGARKVVFLISDQIAGCSLAEDAPGCGPLRRALASLPEPTATSPQVLAFRTLYAACRALDALGVTAKTVIGSGIGNTVVGAVLERYSLAEGETRAAAFAPPGKPLDRERLAQVLRTLCKDGTPAFVEIGPPGGLRQALATLRPELAIVPTWPAAGGSPLAATAELYRRGVAIDWDRHYQGQQRRRVVLPSYPFERRRCWIGEPFSDAELDAEGRDKSYAGERDDPALLLQGPGATAVRDADVSEVEARLAELWGEVLKLTEVARDSDFIALGGDSLNGVQLLELIDERFGVELDVLDLFEHGTLSEMAAKIESERPQRATPAAAEARPQPSPDALIPNTGATSGPLSSPQRQVYYLCKLEDDRSLYCASMSFHIRGALDVAALGASFDRIVARHGVLRTTYSDDGPTQHVRDPARFAMRVVDLRDREESDARTEMRALRRGERHFDLGDDLPLRATLYRLEDERAVLALSVHHIAVDGWSLGILVRELAVCYQATARGVEPQLPALPVQYIDYARWQRARLESGALDHDLGFWVDRLTPLPAPLRLPRLGRAEAGGDGRTGARALRTMPAALGDALRAFGQRREASLFMALLSGYAALLHRYTGQTDLVIGAPVANRSDAVKQVIGYFSNTLPLRLDLSGEPSFLALLDRVKAAVVEGLGHQEVPLDRIIQALQPERDAGSSPVVQTLFALQNTPTEMNELFGLEVTADAPDTSIAQFGLSLSLRETPGGIVEFAESYGHLDEVALTQLLRHLETLIEAALREPERPIATLAYLTADEQRDLVAWSDSKRSSDFNLEW